MKYKVFCFSVIATLVITSECQTRRPGSPPRRPPSPPRPPRFPGPPQNTACPPTCHDRQKPGDPCGRAAPAVLEARSTILKDHFSACQLNRLAGSDFQKLINFICWQISLL
uniref:Putative secreted protein n=1 Tax=Amblyomma triste TaxID=251400 RepID=A0A023G478_AMBTT